MNPRFLELKRGFLFLPCRSSSLGFAPSVDPFPIRRIRTDGGVVGARQSHNQTWSAKCVVQCHRVWPTAGLWGLPCPSPRRHSRPAPRRSTPISNPQSPIPPTPLLQNFKVPRKNALMIRDVGAILKQTWRFPSQHAPAPALYFLYFWGTLPCSPQPATLNLSL